MAFPHAVPSHAGPSHAGPAYSVPLTAAEDNAAVGGKGASLGSLARAGAAIPAGFVVTSSAFTASLDALDPGGSLR